MDSDGSGDEDALTKLIESIGPVNPFIVHEEERQRAPNFKSALWGSGLYYYSKIDHAEEAQYDWYPGKSKILMGEGGQSMMDGKLLLVYGANSSFFLIKRQFSFNGKCCKQSQISYSVGGRISVGR